MESVEFSLIKNTVKTNDLSILKDLTNLKNLYARQLAKMPRQYLVKLLFDTVHESIIIKKDGKIVAGITYRGFQKQFFYEIAFLAVNNQNQCQGFGSMVMNKFKNHCQQKLISHIFTFADDGAIGFFQKHGFSKQISLPEQSYKAYIKQYVGGQLMECQMNLKHKIDYEKLKDQVKHIKNHIIYNKVKPLLCLAPYDFQKSVKIINLKADKCKTLSELAQFIPGLKEAGYTKGKYNDEEKKLTLPFFLCCQQFIQIAFSKAAYLKQGLQVQDEQYYNPKKPTENQIRQKILNDYYFLLYKMERRLKFGHFRYKDEIIEEFTNKLKQVLPLNEKLRPNERQFLTKINQLKYDFMKNMLPPYSIKSKKIKPQNISQRK